MVYHANIQQKKTGVSVLISHKVDFRTKNITRDKESIFIIIIMG